MKALDKYFSKRVTIVRQIMSQPLHEFRPETFHKLRVEVKKLNAIADLINFSDKAFKRRKAMKGIRKLYDSAGDIRELQIEEKFFLQYFPRNFIKSYRSKLRSTKLFRRKQFSSLLKKKKRIAVVRELKDLKKYVVKLNRKDLKSYLDEKAKRIKVLLEASRTDHDKLHTLRKEIKQYFYLCKISTGKTEGIIHEQQEMVSMLLGEYHDLQVMLDNILNALDQPVLKDTEKAQLLNVKSIIQDKIQHAFTLLRKELYPEIILATPLN